MLHLLVTANVVYSSLILFTLMMEVIQSSGTLVLTRATWRHILTDGIFHVMLNCNTVPYTNSLTGLLESMVPADHVSSQRPPIMTGLLCGFFQSLQLEGAMLPHIRPQLLPAVSFPVYCSLLQLLLCCIT
jgi:hypothetical protein